jgi:bifunctional NMN adenylyltransferase/nudix hydrolase
MKIGCIIGRYQVPYLHAGHKDLINYVKDNNESLILLIGTNPVSGTRYNPMDFQTRKIMIQRDFPEAVILPLIDKSNNKAWSEQIDQILNNLYQFNKNITIYGGRDNSLSCYQGNYKTETITSINKELSGTSLRKEAAGKVLTSEDFRAGIIYNIENSFPKIVPCVDIAIVKSIFELNPLDMKEYEVGKKILLGRKSGNSLWCFPGGHVDIEDESSELAAAREVMEETGISLCLPDELEYIGSAKIQDYRYKNGDALHTTFFLAELWYDREIKAADDLAELKWFSLEKDTKLQLISNHRKLYDMLVKHLEKGSKIHAF